MHSSMSIRNQEAMNIASFITITPAANSKSWLDAKIRISSDMETLRWKWLGLFVIVGALLPMDSSVAGEASAVFTPLLACFISACWYRAPVTLKAVITFGAGCAVFLHRELPVPGIGYGFFHLIGYAVTPSTDWRWLLVSLAINAAMPMLMVVLFHYLAVTLSVLTEFLNPVWQSVRQLLFDIPEETERSPSGTQGRVNISS